MFLDILELGIENKTKIVEKPAFIMWPQICEKMLKLSKIYLEKNNFQNFDFKGV